MSEFEKYTFERSVQRDIHEHEVLFSFNNDGGAERFMYWWDDVGEESFQTWQLENE